MKVGDLVTLKMKKSQPPQVPRGGVIINTWKNHKNKLLQIEILWGEGNIDQHRPELFEVISESR